MAKSKLLEVTFEPDELLALARLDIDKGDVEQGLLKLKQLLALEMPPAEVFPVAARVYAQLRLFDRAQSLFKHYLVLHPEAEIELFQLGMTYLDSDQGQEAMQIWDQLLKVNATHPPALFYRALCLANEARVVDARQTLDILLQAIPADNLYFGKGKTLLDTLNRGQIPNEAAGAAQPASHKLPKGAYQTEH